MVGRDLDGGGAHAGGELPLDVGRDRLVTVGDQEPGRQRSDSPGPAVVELESVKVDAVIEFLSFPEMARPRWNPVFTHLRQHRHGPLAAAFSTPLMVSLLAPIGRGHPLAAGLARTPPDITRSASDLQVLVRGRFD
jgi:hypothetical protein